MENLKTRNRIFFTSDTHFGHKNSIKYCNRPFSSVEEMDETLINNWNSVVSPESDVYHLGDFAFAGISRTKEILDQLNGRIHLIKGNHDRKITNQLRSEFVWVRDYYELKIKDKDANRGNQSIILLHYAMRTWDKAHHGSWHLYGHSHGSIQDFGKSFDCGVDAQNYRPISYEEVKEKMKTKTFVSLDHH